MISCKNENSKLITDFEELEEFIESQQFLDHLKTLPEDSLYLISGIFYGEVTSMVDEPKKTNKRLLITIDSLIEKYNLEGRIEVLGIAFQNYLNRKDFNIENIESRVMRLQEIRDFDQKEKEESKKRELSKIIELNDLEWNLGDTLNLRRCLKIIFHLRLNLERIIQEFINRTMASEDSTVFS